MRRALCFLKSQSKRPTACPERKPNGLNAQRPTLNSENSSLTSPFADKNRHLPLALTTEIQQRNSLRSRFLFRGQFLKARIIPDLIPPRIEPQQRRSYGIPIRNLQQPLENGNCVVGISE